MIRIDPDGFGEKIGRTGKRGIAPHIDYLPAQLDPGAAPLEDRQARATVRQ
jgi:hypothetical protein